VLTAKPRRQQVVADNRDLSDQDVFKCAIPGVKLQQRTRSAIIPEKRVPKSLTSAHSLSLTGPAVESLRPKD